MNEYRCVYVLCVTPSLIFFIFAWLCLLTEDVSYIYLMVARAHTHTHIVDDVMTHFMVIRHATHAFESVRTALYERACMKKFVFDILV